MHAAAGTPGPAARAFDYGEADEIESTIRRTRREIAAAIRRAAAADEDATFTAQQAYEHAARLAEGDLGVSADERAPR
jgi:hypothetical protein